MVQPDAFCFYTMDNYGLSGAEGEEFLYIIASGSADDIGMFYIYMHCTGRLVTFGQSFLWHRRCLHFDSLGMVHQLVQTDQEVSRIIAPLTPMYA